MDEKRAIDTQGALFLSGFAAVLALNQVVIKVTSGGFGPVFQAGLRSLGAIAVLMLWAWARGLRIDRNPVLIPWGVLSGLLFTAEFIALFLALDLGAVSRVSILFYSMPVWLGLAAHVWLPGERLSPQRWLGMGLAMGGVALALMDRGSAAGGVWGDVLAIVAALCWGGIALVARLTPMARTNPETQLIYQLVVSAPLLLLAAPLFGPLIRDLQPLHLAGLVFQMICVASLGFLLWFHLIATYRASSVASFSFLSPVLAVLFGWLLLGETLSPKIWLALALVAGGVVLINRR